MDSFTKFTISITAILLGILMIGVGCLLYALPVYLLWNWVIPSVFSLPEITMLQSLLIVIMAIK